MKYLGIHIANDLTSSTNTLVVVKKAQQQLHSLCRLRKTDLPSSHLITFYRSTVESILTYSFTSWFGGCSAKGKKQLNRTVKTAKKIIGAPLHCLIDL